MEAVLCYSLGCDCSVSATRQAGIHCCVAKPALLGIVYVGQGTHTCADKRSSLSSPLSALIDQLERQSCRCRVGSISWLPPDSAEDRISTCRRIGNRGPDYLCVKWVLTSGRQRCTLLINQTFNLLMRLAVFFPCPPFLTDASCSQTALLYHLHSLIEISR